MTQVQLTRATSVAAPAPNTPPVPLEGTNWKVIMLPPEAGGPGNGPVNNQRFTLNRLFGKGIVTGAAGRDGNIPFAGGYQTIQPDALQKVLLKKLGLENAQLIGFSFPEVYLQNLGLANDPLINALKRADACQVEGNQMVFYDIISPDGMPRLQPEPVLVANA